MDSKNHIKASLNLHYFWDIDFSTLDEAAASRLIIERIFSLGEMHEMNQVIDFYGKSKVIAILCNLAYIDPKTFNFITKFFNKPDEEFKCYQLKQSKPEHWSL
jgi:hypothetical protein